MEMNNIPNYKQCICLYGRDPTELDLNDEETVWISLEYSPHRVFRGKDGKWKFIGKFYPISEAK